jgi:hypothetical protein
MDYTKPKITDYGDLTELTAAVGMYGYEDAGSKDPNGRFVGRPPGSAAAP